MQNYLSLPDSSANQPIETTDEVPASSSSTAPSAGSSSKNNLSIGTLGGSAMMSSKSMGFRSHPSNSKNFAIVSNSSAQLNVGASTSGLSKKSGLMSRISSSIRKFSRSLGFSKTKSSVISFDGTYVDFKCDSMYSKRKSSVKSVGGTYIDFKCDSMYVSEKPPHRVNSSGICISFGI